VQYASATNYPGDSDSEKRVTAMPAGSVADAAGRDDPRERGAPRTGARDEQAVAEPRLDAGTSRSLDGAGNVVGTDETTKAGTTRRSVVVSFVVSCAEALALGVAAWLSGSFAVGAQALAGAADVGVQVFLLIGVLSSARPADDTHPLGYGRERFFWSFLAALGSFAGGGGLGLAGAAYAALHPSPVDHYPIAYLVLVATLVLDAFALEVALRSLRKQAATRDYSLRTLLERTTDSAAKALVVGGGTAVIGGVVALAGLFLSQQTGSPTPDTVASALIGMLLLAGSVLLLHQNRELLTGRGVPLPMVREMRRVVAAQSDVLDVPDLFAVVVGPSSLIVDGDVTLSDDLDVPQVEQTIMHIAGALRQRWPMIDYVYLTPVPNARPRGAPRFRPADSGRGHRS